MQGVYGKVPHQIARAGEGICTPSCSLYLCIHLPLPVANGGVNETAGKNVEIEKGD